MSTLAKWYDKIRRYRKYRIIEWIVLRARAWCMQYKNNKKNAGDGSSWAPRQYFFRSEAAADLEAMRAGLLEIYSVRNSEKWQELITIQGHMTP